MANMLHLLTDWWTKTKGRERHAHGPNKKAALTERQLHGALSGAYSTALLRRDTTNAGMRRTAAVTIVAHPPRSHSRVTPDMDVVPVS
jgi:hypothetical protein